jgi:PPP family 3-phenylpropionic acid transporter
MVAAKMALPSRPVILARMAPGTSPALLLAAFWFLYLAGLGVIFPFQSLYFHENAALTGTQLGIVIAMRPLMGMLSQGFWGQVSDRSGARGRVLVVLAAGAGVAYVLLPFAAGFVPTVIAVAFAALFATSVIPMASAVSMAALGDEAARRFGRIRVWGTVGFLVTVVLFPRSLAWIQHALGWRSGPAGVLEGPSEPGLGIMFFASALLCFAAAALALRLPKAGAFGLRSQPGDLRRLLRHRPYRRAIVVAFAAFFLLQAPIGFFPVFVRARGGSLDTVGTMWIAMLLVEIPLVFLTGTIVTRIGGRGLIALGVLADGLRWTLCAFALDLRLIGALQVLHGVAVAGTIVGIQLYVESVIPARLRSTGQAMVTVVGVSLGGTLSAIVGGWLFENLGIDALYLAGGVGALALGFASPWLLPPPHRQALWKRVDDA